MKALELGDARDTNTVTLADERDRAGNDLPAGAFASVTLEAPDQSWGEFLTEADVARIHAWTAALLADTYAQERDR